VVEPRGDLGQFIGAARSQDDARSARDRHFRSRQADAARRAGNDDDLVAQFPESHSFSSAVHIYITHRQHTSTAHTAGVRFAGSYSRKFQPFAQVLIGAEHCCSSTHFAVQPGIGVDIPWRRAFALRAQVDWRHVNQPIDPANGLRIGLGFVFPMNR
jgi:hypothetical protein